MIARAAAIVAVLAGCSVRETSSSPGAAEPPPQKTAEPVAPVDRAADPATAPADPPRPVAGPSRPPQPVEPDSPDRRCASDDDCALIPDDCTTCPPCEATWRQAANKKKVQKIVAERARVPCPPIMCPQCTPTPTMPGQPRAETGYIGDRAVCRAEQCVVE